MSSVYRSETLSIGLMLFALFFGAGNLIFPPALGQASGTEFGPAITGFVITGVGLPLLAVIALAVTGGNMQTIGSRVHPLFGLIFTVIIYLAIGPFFGIPRTGSVAFEMGAVPFLPAGMKETALLVFTVFYFSLTFWLCLNPSKLVDRIGKVLTPLLLIILTVILAGLFLNPIGSPVAPSDAFQSEAFFGGFVQGYLTMDTLGALVFGLVVISAAKGKGIKESPALARTVISAAVIAGAGLAFVYLTLGWLGATSSTLGTTDNGAEILTRVVASLFGDWGALLLGTAVSLACLTTSVGLVSACGMFFSRIIPAASYKLVVGILCLASLLMANVGLTQIISVSVPVLAGIYPIAIVLILLSFLQLEPGTERPVYAGAVIGTALVSVIDGLNEARIPLGGLGEWYAQLPLYNQGIGWLLPAIAGTLIGFLWMTVRGSRVWKKAEDHS
ncbi:branched-chain amino acid transport system II carrier protein [Salinithrix halophila]|uniref:Branched-chain amino acid transport system carrier protein n=1 Tax=Salinithrix halophila TaxID=1485204 RepID=A0ABV8JCM0_9BACL